MWTPVKIEMVNLFSHPHSQYEFKPGACTVIFGRNLSDRSLENNGAGKTTLFEAVCIALTGDSLRKIDKEVFINEEANQCDIVFEMYNAVLRQSLRIERHFYRGGKSSRVELYENNKLNTQMTSVAECNKRILEMIGISREDLLRYYIISQDNHYTFFNATDGEKKEIMNRITSADMILPVIEEIDRRNADLQERRGDIQREVDKLTERKETLEEQAEELVSANDDEGAAWTELEERAKEFDSKAEQARGAVRQLEKDYVASVRQRDSMKCDEFKIQEWEDKIRTKREEIDETEEQIVECSRIKREIDLFFAGKVVCPKCGETFVPNGKLKLSIPEAKKLYEQTEQNESKFYTILEQKKKNLKLYKDNKNKAVEAVDVYRRADRAVQAINVNLQNQRDLVDSYVRRAEKARTDAKVLREDVAWKRQLEDLKNKIADTEKRLTARKKDLQPLDDELSLLKFWKYNMGRGGFQTYLANKSVSVIEGITNSYLERFGVDIRVRISGFKVLKNGDVREKIDVFVSKNGIEWSAFMGKSGGERGRVTLAGVLGIQRLINLSTGGRGLDLLLFDECFHGMDSRGQENIIKVFEKMGSTIMVITQDVSESFNNENTLVVVKEGGESRYL